MTQTVDTMNTLCLVELSTFPQDLYDDMVFIGISHTVAEEIMFAYTMMKDRSIIKLYQEYAFSLKNDVNGWKEAIVGFINYRVKQFEKIQSGE